MAFAKTRGWCVCSGDGKSVTEVVCSNGVGVTVARVVYSIGGGLSEAGMVCQ